MPRSQSFRILVVASVAAVLCFVSPAPAGAGVARADSAVRAAAPLSLTVTSPLTGGAAIPASRARVGGSGIWTELRGLVLTEGSSNELGLNDEIRLELPLGFEWNPAGTNAPRVVGCELQASPAAYPEPDAVSIRMIPPTGWPIAGPCRIEFGTLKVRPVSAASLARGGSILIRVREATPATVWGLADSAGTIGMVVPSPSYPSVVPATGASAIPRETARIGGSGAWTILTGPILEESADLQLLAGMSVNLALPAGFEWNPAIDLHPSVTGCDRTLSGSRYHHEWVIFDVRDAAGDAPIARCRIDFGSVLLLRPVAASGAAGTGGDLTIHVTGSTRMSPVTLPASAGRIAMAAAPPPAVAIALAANAPTMVNGAILWGEAVDLVTTAPVGTAFQLQVTTDNVTWETLKDAAGTPLTFTVAADGRHTYRYTPVRNYWYRAVAGTSLSNTPRVAVRQTIVIRPIQAGTRRVAPGTSVTFTATVRPVRPELAKASVRFELYRRSGSSWVLARSTTIVIDDAGVARSTFTFGSGRWYVRAQAQPTQVNANSFWTPSQSYAAE